MKADYLLLLAGMLSVTFLPRFLPMAWLSRIKMPKWLEIWLSYIPVGILAALLGKALFVPNGRIDLQLFRPEILALVPAILLGIKTRNLFLPVLVGIAGVALLRLVM